MSKRESSSLHGEIAPDKREFARWVQEFVGVTGLALSEVQIAQLADYYGLLYEWNQKMNLTSILAPKEAAIKHVIDSLMVHRYCSFSEGDNVVDVGTGAGIPGVILKIAYPGIRLELLDSLRKRLDFLEVVIATLELKDVATWHVRAEEAGREARAREAFSIVTARAVAKTSVLLEYCAPLCRVGGKIIAYKGPEYREELASAQRAMDILGVRVADIATYTLPEDMGQRSLIIFEKVAPTSETYPRKTGIPAKKPL